MTSQYFLLYLPSSYSRPLPDNVMTLPTATERSCVAYTTFHSNSSNFGYRFRMRDVDCRAKASFVCVFNPGEDFLLAPNIALLSFACTPQIVLLEFFHRDLLSQWQVDLYSFFPWLGANPAVVLLLKEGPLRKHHGTKKNHGEENEEERGRRWNKPTEKPLHHGWDFWVSSSLMWSNTIGLLMTSPIQDPIL